jgi:hypothetical protein
MVGELRRRQLLRLDLPSNQRTEVFGCVPLGRA